MATIFDRKKYISTTGKNVMYVRKNSNGDYQIVRKKISDRGWYAVKVTTEYDLGSSKKPEDMQVILDNFAKYKELEEYDGE